MGDFQENDLLQLEDNDLDTDTSMSVPVTPLSKKRKSSTDAVLTQCLSVLTDFKKNTSEASQVERKDEDEDDLLAHLDEAAVQDDCAETIPVAVPRANFTPVPADNTHQITFIMFDLETTDLISWGEMPHITQIAAMEMESGDCFDEYIFPKVPISFEASYITGITVSEDNKFKVHGEEVNAVFLKEGLNRFISWVQKFSNAVLIAHNGRRFDFPITMNAVRDVNLIDSFMSVIFGLIDSLVVLRKAFPGQKTYQQVRLVRSLLNQSYRAHNGLEDVKALRSLMQKTNWSSENLMKSSFKPDAVLTSLLFKMEVYKNIGSLDVLIRRGIVKQGTAEKIAGSGLNLAHLLKIFQRDGERGLQTVFIQNNRENQPRVTKSKRVLEDAIPKLAEYFRSTNAV